MKTLINDDQALVSATHNGAPLKTYDDGYGGLFIFCNSSGPVGIVRAMSWHDAYEIVDDEFQPESDETIDYFIKEYGEFFMDDVCFQESYGFRPNGPNDTDKMNHGIYEKDLCGERLEILMPAMVEEWLIALEIEAA